MCEMCEIFEMCEMCVICEICEMCDMCEILCVGQPDNLGHTGAECPVLRGEDLPHHGVGDGPHPQAIGHGGHHQGHHQGHLQHPGVKKISREQEQDTAQTEH